jgi:hypothetical protein
LAGRTPNGSRTLYSWYTGNGPNNIFYKAVSQSTTPALRTSSPTAQTADPFFAPNPFNSSTSFVTMNLFQGLLDTRLTIFDITGKELFDFTGSAEKLNAKVSEESAVLERGIYIFKLSSPTKQQQWLMKMIKM